MSIPRDRRRPYDTTEPSSLSAILSELMNRRGYARVQGNTQLREQWNEVAMEIIGDHVDGKTKVLNLRNGTLEIAVGNSALIGEMESFLKATLLEELQTRHPDLKVRALKFKKRGSLS